MISRSKTAALAALACLLITVLGGTPVLAEISAEFDYQGNYVRMIYLTNASGQNLRIWSSQRAGRGNIHPLNPDGDVLMDSWPFYVENRFESNRPYVVWSRFNGTDYDLVWTRLTADGEWAAVDWVEWDAHPGMDQDPFLASHPDGGRPHLVWCSDEDGVGHVYLSILLESGWADRFLVSDPGVDSRYPVIDLLEDDQIQVTYDTADGVVSRMITSNSPDSVKDDVDPKAGMHDDDDPNFRTKSSPDDG